MTIAAVDKYREKQMIEARKNVDRSIFQCFDYTRCDNCRIEASCLVFICEDDMLSPHYCIECIKIAVNNWEAVSNWEEG